MFRSSGRFGWPLSYVLVVWAVVTVARRLPRRAALAVLGVAVGCTARRPARRPPFRRRAARDPEFHSWPQLFASRAGRRLPPPIATWSWSAAAVRRAADAYEPAVRLAAGHAMTVNAGVIARRDLRAQGRYCRDADAAIDAVRLRDDTIYVVSESAAGVLTRMGGPAVACGHIDTVWMCTTAAAHQAWANAAPFD